MAQAFMVIGFLWFYFAIFVILSRKKRYVRRKYVPCWNTTSHFLKLAISNNIPALLASIKEVRAKYSEVM